MPTLFKLDYSNAGQPSGVPLPLHLIKKTNDEFRAELSSLLVPVLEQCFLTVTVALLNDIGYSHAEFAKISLLDENKKPIGDYESEAHTAFMSESEARRVAYLRIDGILFPDLTEHSLILPCRLDTTEEAPYSRITVWVDVDTEKVSVSTDSMYNLNWMTEIPVKFGTADHAEWNENVLIEIPEEGCAAL